MESLQQQLENSSEATATDWVTIYIMYQHHCCLTYLYKVGQWGGTEKDILGDASWEYGILSVVFNYNKYSYCSTDHAVIQLAS